MRSITRTASICVKDSNNIEFVFCKLTHIQNEDDTFTYIFEPNYSVISLMSAPYFQGIPGINLDLKKDKYIRENITPVFISERVPNKNREDLYELLEEVGLEYIDPLLYLIRTKYFYSGDRYYVKEYKEKEEVKYNFDNSKENLSSIITKIISSIARGDKIVLNDLIIDDNNRLEIFKAYLFLYKKSFNYKMYKQSKGIEIAKNNNTYKGRKPIEVDIAIFKQYLDMINKKEITVKQATKEMNISINKYYRVKKQIDNSN